MPRLVPTEAVAGREPPTLRGDGLALRLRRSSDVPALIDADRDQDSRQRRARSMTTDEDRTWVETTHGHWRAAAGWAVTIDGQPQSVTSRMALRRIDLEHRVGGLASWPRPDRRGRRIVTRALRVPSGWCIGPPGRRRLDIEHAVGNVASCRTVDRAGHRWEGTQRSKTLLCDGWHDVHLHVLVGPEPDHPRSDRYRTGRDERPGGMGKDRGMKPAPFAWHGPDDAGAAVALLAEHGPEAKVLAGGQSLVPLLAM